MITKALGARVLRLRMRLFLTGTTGLLFVCGAVAGSSALNFPYSPPEWQTAICLPDDPRKSLVDRTGELLYHYNQGREFGTRIGIEVVPDARWQSQELVSPRVPIVKTFRAAEGLSIVEEAFAVTDVPQPKKTSAAPLLRRTDGSTMNQGWAQPPPGFDPALRNIALHYAGGLKYELTVPRGGAASVAMALCEGYWKEPGKRIQILRVEGAPSRTVDTIADLGPNRPGAFWFEGKDANGDGQIDISVDAAPNAADNNTILNGLWAFKTGAKVDSESLLAGRAGASALAQMNGLESPGPGRTDVILVYATNTGSSERTVSPRFIVDTVLPFEFQQSLGQVRINSRETVTSSLPMTGVAESGKTRRIIELAPQKIPPGKTASFFVAYSAGEAAVLPGTLKKAVTLRREAQKFWETAPLPYGHISVPDPRIQGLVDSSIRNIWQAREIKKGLPAFQVGPTCYRGLWIVDGSFLLEAAALVGAGDQARNGVAYELTYQKPDGRIEVMQNFSKENGIVLWTCVRHAQLTQDKEWLAGLWPKLERVAAHIRTLRQQTLTNSSTLDDGLLPAGFPDGGIGGVMDEYTNPYWNLVGLRAFIQGAHWLGKADAAAEWQKEYDDFMAAYRRAAARDMKKDALGNRYVPIRMDGQDLPQRGQWAFCHAVYPGQIFSKEDPIVAGTMAMLEATEREGMVYGTGWDATGIWNYFASFYGHAWLWQGNGLKAARVLNAFADHASPTLAWREEQSLKGEKFKKVGDMPHNWASAEFIRLTVHLLALDRGEEMHLLEGMPPEWLGPGMVTQLSRVATPFGPLNMEVKCDSQGRSARISAKALASNCKAIIVHLPGGGTEQLDPRRGGSITFPITAGSGKTAGK